MNKEQLKKSNAGRKPLDEADRKATFILYLPGATITKLGGEDALKKICYKLINNELNKLT